MYVGLAISATIHAGLIGLALVNFAGTKPLRAPVEQPVEVAIITADELVRLKQGDRASKNLETQRAPEAQQTDPRKKESQQPPPRRAPAPPPPPPPPASPAVQQEPPPPEPPPAAAADPIAQAIAKLETPAPDPDALALRRLQDAEAKAAEAKAAEAKAAEERQRAAAEAETKRKAEAERKRKEAEAKRREEEKKRREAEDRRKRQQAEAEAKRRQAEAERKRQESYEDRMAALLNKIPNDRAPRSGSQTAPEDRTLPRGPQAGAPEGRDTRLTASQTSMIAVMMRSQTQTCWNINSGIEGASQMIVEVDVRLRRDGTIDGTPRVVNARSDSVFRDAANGALRALIQCAPYDLPANLYEGGWDHMIVTFDPQKMF